MYLLLLREGHNIIKEKFQKNWIARNQNNL
jgi:hypothetical protein